MVSRGRFGVITGDSETLRVDKLESEVVGAACGAADRGDVSKNGSNK